MQESLFFLAEQFVSCILISWGLSCIIQTKLWVRLIQLFYNQKEEIVKLTCLVVSMIFLPLGFILLLTHNDWSANPAVIVTVLGWLISIKCLTLMLWPQIALKCKSLYLKNDSFLKWYLRICGALYISMGLLILANFWVA